jgi:hypothetical protein
MFEGWLGWPIPKIFQSNFILLDNFRLEIEKFVWLKITCWTKSCSVGSGPDHVLRGPWMAW